MVFWHCLKQDDSSFPTSANLDAFLPSPENEEANDHVNVQEDLFKLVHEIGAGSTDRVAQEREGRTAVEKLRARVPVGSDAGPGKMGLYQFVDRGDDDDIRHDKRHLLT